MSRSESTWWFADLLAAAVLTALATVAVLAGLPGPLRIPFVMPLLLFLPGYALVSLLFPATGSNPASLPEVGDRRPSSGLATEGPIGLDTPGRLVLSVVFSSGLVGLGALAVNFMPVGLSAAPLAITIGAATLGLLSLAAARRRSYPTSERFAPTLPRPDLPWADEGRYRFRYTPWNARIPNLALLVGVLLLTASLGYAAVDSPESSEFTEFRIATENMTGETQALYDQRLTAGQAQDVGVIVTNHEGTDVDYTIVAVLERVERTDSGVTVQESRVVGRRDVSVAAGERQRVGVSVRPPMTGDDLRLTLLLYRDGAPDEPSARTAYRSIRVQVVVESGAESLAGPR